MMDKRPRKELIDSMREKLRNFEEPYDPSEWAYFKKYRRRKCKKPIPLFVRLAGIAAALVVVVYASVQVLPLLDRSDEAGERSVKDSLRTPSDLRKEQAVPPAVDSITEPVIEAIPQSSALAPVRRETVADKKPVLAAKPGEMAMRPQAISLGDGVEEASSDGILATPRSVMADIIHQSVKTSPRGPRRGLRINLSGIAAWRGGWPDAGRVDVGGHVTPLLTNRGFSVGLGASARLPLSNRLQAEIGVSYLNMKVGQDNELDPADTLTSPLAGVRHAVGMVALPLSLNYAISENVSISFGLTPFRVVRDQRTDVLQRNRWISGGLSPGDSTRGRMVAERTRSRWADSLYRGNTYVGFVKLSARYNPPILRRRNLVLEPFVAIPVGKLRDDEHRWLNGGVSIRFYFP